MNRKDLKDYKYTQDWIKNQEEYIQKQMETVNRLNSILSDMPKGSRVVYDNEAEKLTSLMDKFNELMDIVIEEKEKQKAIIENINKIDFPYRNILFKVYIQGKTLVTVASEMNYSYERIKHMNRIALMEFDKLEEKNEKFKNIY